jgi:hypothetical protein
MPNQQMGMCLHNGIGGGLYRWHGPFLGNWSEKVLMGLGLSIGFSEQEFVS